MKTSESFELLDQFSTEQKRKLNKYEQYYLFHEEFEQSMIRFKLLPASVLKSFFGVKENPFLDAHAVMHIATDPLLIDRCYLLAVNRAYLLVGIEIYTLDEIDYQSRFLVEVGYSVSGFMSEPARRHFEILNSICDLENFIRKFNKWNDVPFFAWEMSD